MTEPIWSPSPQRIANARLTRFIKDVARDRKLALPDYQSLWQYSVDEPNAFWMDLWNFLGIRAQPSPTVAVEDVQALPGARWFPGARLNFAENLVRRADEGDAIVFRGEDGRRRTLSWGALLAQVAACAAALESAGAPPRG